MPQVQIIVPTHNRKELLSEAMDSVLEQTFQDFQILVIDDGSTDDTRDLIGGYAKKYPGKVVYEYQANKGAAPARNNGIQRATAEFIAFLDDDDLWMPTKLEQQVALMRRRPAVGLVYCGSEWVNEDDTGIKVRYPCKARNRGRVLPRLVRFNFIPTPTVLMRRDVATKIGLMSERLVFGEDWHYWLRAACVTQIDFVDGFLVKFRDFEEGISAKADMDRMVHDNLLMLELIFADPLFASIHAKRQDIYHHFHYRFAMMALGDGKLDAAVSYFKAALRYRWASFKNLMLALHVARARL